MKITEIESTKHIGYWKEKYGTDNYPVPIENSATPEQVKAQLAILDVIGNKARKVEYKGSSTCRICGERVGSAEYQLGEFRIPEGIKHYINSHSVLVPGLLD